MENKIKDIFADLNNLLPIVKKLANNLNQLELTEEQINDLSEIDKQKYLESKQNLQNKLQDLQNIDISNYVKNY